MEDNNKFLNTLPAELQQKIQLLPPEKQDEVIGKLMGKSNLVPVEAERNENITVADGGTPVVAGGYLKKLSNNPVSGESTYEIPDDVYSDKHTEGGVDMFLPDGAVVNSDKTKLNIDFLINKKNFKGKTIKEASDYLSKYETDLQDEHAENIKNGLVDKVTESSLDMMLAKASMSRKQLNDLQDVMLENKNQREGKTDNKAEAGIKAALANFKNFSGKIKDAHKDGLIGIDQIKSIASQTGILNQADQFDYSTYQPGASASIDDFKSKIAGKESGAYKNPYIAISGINESDAEKYSFDELKGKAASSAIGKYQFLWNTWKKPIEKITGIKTADDFRNNPEAQENFMDWYSENELLPKAVKLKQKYLLPMDNYQVMAMLHLEGESRLEKKLKTGALNTKTMAANSFQNPSPQQYAQGFKWGGKIKAENGTNLLYSKALDRINSGELDFNALQTLYDRISQTKKRGIHDVGDITDTVLQLFGDNTNQKGTNPNDIIPLTDANALGFHMYENPAFKGTDLLGDNYRINSNINPPKLQDTWSKKSDSYLNSLGQFLSYYKQQNPDNGVSVPVPPINFKDFNDNYENLGNNNYDRNSLNKLKRNNVVTDDDSISNDNAVQDNTVQNSSGSWADKLKYGLREAAPYLSALRRWNEKIIPPVLQQKPYDNPYDNISTDVNIQSALNDIDRTTLTGIASSTGNPSVRNARIAQMIANTYPAKSSLYSQKYNQEQQLENNKTLGQGQYRNQWTDVNMDLRKRYEQEWLKTLEVQRQQKAMAEDYMTNVGLRSAEQQQAIKMGLLNTPYDYNKFTQDFTLNKEKQAQEFMLEKIKAGMRGGNDGTQIIKGKDGIEYEVITPENGAPVVRKVKKAYGGKVKKKILTY